MKYGRKHTKRKPRDWKLIPRWAYRKEPWPRVFQFHWLFFYCHRIETPA